MRANATGSRCAADCTALAANGRVTSCVEVAVREVGVDRWRSSSAGSEVTAAEGGRGADGDTFHASEAGDAVGALGVELACSQAGGPVGALAMVREMAAVAVFDCYCGEFRHACGGGGGCAAVGDMRG